jgi:integrase
MGVKVRKRNGSWWLFINHRGVRKAKKIGTREAAEKVKRELEARLALGDTGCLSKPKLEPTFAAYSEGWLDTYAELHCKPSTAASYRQLLRLYLVPWFGPVALRRITRDSVRDFLADMATKTRAKRKTQGENAVSQEPQSKLSRNTLRLALSTLRVILNHAMDDGLVDRNPAVRLGKFTITEKPKAQAQALTREEVEQFLQATQEICPDYYPLFLTAVRGGLRRGELVALRWGDIQFGTSEEDPNRYIYVQRNYVQGAFTTPKSKKPRRVDLSRELRKTLLELRDKRLLDAFLEGESSIADELVFPSQTGDTVLDPDNLVHYYFLPALEKAGLRKIRFHDLRHTFGSLLIQDGASLTYVKEQMGHSSIQVTVDVYGHLIPGENIAWVDGLDRKTSPQQNATQAQPEPEVAKEEQPEVLEEYGERGRNRTFNLLIKSQLLCQLSYAPGKKCGCTEGWRKNSPALN